jgi:hypothetical protein
MYARAKKVKEKHPHGIGRVYRYALVGFKCVSLRRRKDMAARRDESRESRDGIRAHGDAYAKRASVNCFSIAPPLARTQPLS